MYQPRIYSLSLRMVRRAEDAQDVTQETFVRMFRALDRYDLDRPFAAWLFTIASRLCIDHLRRKRIQPISLSQHDAEGNEDWTIEVVDPGLTPDVVTSHREEEKQTQE